MKKMFKYLSYTTIILSFGFFLNSCEGDLEPEIYDRISPSNFFKSIEDVNVAVNGVYASYRASTNGYSWGTASRILAGSNGTDEWFCNWGGYKEVNDFLWFSDNSRYSNIYFEFMPAITRAGVTVELIKDIDFLPEDQKERYIAEVKTARAMWMFDMLNMYGPVAVVVDRENLLNPDNNYLPEVPELSWYVNFLVTELTEAADVLPVVGSEWGRITKGTALMQLLKLQMHQKNWVQAEAVSRQIMDLGIYSLQEEYSSVWHVNNQRNSEIIFALPSTANVSAVSHQSMPTVLPGDYKSPDGNRTSGWNGFRIYWDFYDTFDTTDQRLSRLWRFYPSRTGIKDARDPVNGINGAIPAKYSEDPESAGVWSGIDIVVYRYADVLLCRAEALNELSGPSQEVIDLINEIRERAGVSELSIADFDKESLRDHILAERGWEFYMEGLRREDLIRHGKYISRAHERGATLAKDYNVLYPIPTAAIRENPKINQNPGYTH